MKSMFPSPNDSPDNPTGNHPVVIAVQEECDVSMARRFVVCKAKSIGFNTVNTSYLATAVTELASNIVFHASSGGRVAISVIETIGTKGIEIIAEDNGPGIPDISLALTDGFSTRGGLGCGLPGVKRLVDEFDLLSSPGYGTRVVIRTWLR